MPEIVERGTCSQEGVGKPDYSKGVSSALERAGLRLKYNEQLKVFGKSWEIADPEYPLIPAEPLVAGSKEHLENWETRIRMPYAIPAGYSFSVIASGIAFTQDVIIYVYLDGLVSYTVGIGQGGSEIYHNRVRGVSSLFLDPHSEYPHEIDLIIHNLSDKDAYGLIGYDCILEKVGSEDWPTTKECECPYCQFRQVVPTGTTRIICGQCGKLYLVHDFSNLRQTP